MYRLEFDWLRNLTTPKPNEAKRTKRARRQLVVEALESRLLFAGLLAQSDLSYLGAFRVPQGTIGASTFAYGGTAPAFNPANNSMFLVGHVNDQAIAEISIPPIVKSSKISDLNTASIVQPFSTVQSRLPEWTLDSRANIGGLEVVNSQLVGTFYEYYDGNTNAIDSHFKSSSLNLATASYRGLDQVGNLGGGFVGGYMTKVPSEWQAALGAPYLTGQAALSIIGRTSAGPAAFGFNPNALGSTTAPAINYVSYPLSNPLRPETSTNPLFNLTTEINGVVFPPNSDSVIFFGSHGTGAYCYGEAAECNDSARGGKGTHSFGGEYTYQAWAYNAKDFVDVKNGLKQSWEIQPYGVWKFDFPFPEASKHIGGVTFDAATSRLYVSQKVADAQGNDYYPIINVFQLPTSSTPPLAPTLSNIRATGLTTNSATIQWDSNIPATSRVEFGTTSNLGTFSPLNSAQVLNHAVTLTGLQADTNYSYRVISRSADGLETVSSISAFKTTTSSSVIYSYSNPKPLAPSNPSTTISVSNVSQLLSAVSNLKSGQTISIAPGTYNLSGLTDAIYVPQGITNWSIRGATGKRDDVIIRGGGMTGSVRFGFWVGNSSFGTIADLTIDGVQQHGIIANPGANDMLYHGLRIVDSGDQFIKSNPSATFGQGNDRGIVEYSVFEYRTTDNNNYSNGVDVHGGDNWVVQFNLFKNFLNPVGQGIAGPAVLFWNGSTGTKVDGNTFINNARGIALGLEDKPGVLDHSGGVISNNMFYRAAGLASAVDVAFSVADSPNTKIYNNTVLDSSSYPNSVEYRFASTTGIDIRNNLVNKAIVARDNAVGSLANNLANATASMFINASAGDLHLLASATTAINRGVVLSGLTTDLDGQVRGGTVPDIGADEFFSTTTPSNSAPVINPQSFNINENSTNGTIVGTVQASDPEGQALTYSILSGNTNNAFVIDSQTGVLRVNNSSVLDFEARTSVILSVQVADVLGLARNAAVTVRIVNVNEAPTVAAQSFSILENSPVGSLVGTVVASDPEGQALTYSILSGNTSNAFVIDSQTGVLRVNNSSALDFETRTSVTLSVQVADALGLTRSAAVTVQILNVNEAPTILPQSFTILGNSPIGSAVGTVVATDPERAALSFTIVSGNNANQFSLNAATGVITVNSAIPPGTAPTSLSVQVRDPGGLSATATMTILVTTQSLVALFPFNEGTGSTTIDQTGRRTGSISGATWTTGKFGSALQFNGASAMVSVPDDNGLDFTSSFTISTWVRPISVGNWSTAVLKERSGGLAYGLYASDDRSRPAIYVNVGGADIGATGSSPLPLNTWSHLAATFNGSQLVLYVNGQQVGLATASGSVVTSQSPLRIGGNTIWGEYFNGRIDEVRLYRNALAATEISQLASGSGAAATAAFSSSTTGVKSRSIDVLSGVTNGGSSANKAELASVTEPVTVKVASPFRNDELAQKRRIRTRSAAESWKTDVALSELYANRDSDEENWYDADPLASSLGIANS
jgi:hypothetical protein